MRTPRTGPPTTRRRLVTAAAAVALLSLGLATPAAAATPSGSSTPAASPKKNVAALCGMASKGKMHCLSLVRTDIAGHKGVQPNVTPAGYGPGDLTDAYNIPANGGAGQTVAIVDAFDDPNAEADLAVYRAQFGLPACTTANGCFRKIDQRGGTAYPPPDAGWAGEISLDVDMVSAIAPLAHILLVEGDDNSFENLGAAVDQAVAQGALYVSNSYGTGYNSTPGSGEDPTEVTELDAFYNHPGVAMVASSGDSAFGVSYPAASQYVTSVGGTSLVPDGSARGWGESVWFNAFGGPGSGCSIFEAKPAWQTDSGCSMRTVADVSAVSDPETGVAVYDTFGAPGWQVFGGTSAASPIIASTYAVAGSPVSGTYPSSYPYALPGALNDVTTGNNGSCSPSYFCTAGPGYDGPTGLGTPNGVSAFTTGPHGTISGTVTDSVTHAGISGAAVTAGDGHATTDGSGHYTMSVPVGAYDVTASAFGYQTGTDSGVVVTDGGTTTANFALVAQPSVTVSGNVMDGSGHNWPLYATLTIDGVPGGPLHTSPFTGHYSVQLPANATYQFHVTANYPGYNAVSQSVVVGSSDVTANFNLTVDAVGCNAPGYAVHVNGISQSFDTTSIPAGWSVINNTPIGGWEFDDPHPRGNMTGGTGGFAIIDSDFLGIGNHEDTILTSPSADFTGVSTPDLGFDSDYHGFPNSTADVDVSIDGGATWANVWHHDTDDVRGPSHFDIPLPSAANQSNVQVRFHYTGTWAWWWEVDNVFVGSRTCDPVPGGLVAGNVLDANTGQGVNSATVTSNDAPADSTSTFATPDDPNLADGFYWMFSSLTGSHGFTAARNHYQSQSKTANVAGDSTTKLDFSLAAGNVTVTPGSVNKTVNWQGTTTQALTFNNTGGAPATVNLSEQPGGFTLLTKGGAPLNKVNGTFSPLSWHNKDGSLRKATGAAPANANPADAPWVSIADYPTTIQDNGTVVVDGKIYSAFGYTGSVDTAAAYVYDPDAGTWAPVASAADTREKPAFAAINGLIYAAGGWGSNGSPDSKLEIYDPGSNSWTTGASDPTPFAGSGTAVLGGKMYIVGGCTASACGVNNVQVYDPASNSWSTAASYPEAVSWESCGAISGKLYCAGGVTDNGTLVHSYVYDPGADSWSPMADLPIDLWGSGYTAAEGLLLISGGVTNNNATITNQGFALDPAANTWTAIANSNNTEYRGGSACGFYKVGGSPGGLFATPITGAEVLPGNVDCAEVSDVPWLSENNTSFTIPAGGHVTVTVTLNANDPSVTQPGTYTAKLAVATDTPYSVPAVQVSMTVNPPKSWGKIAGTVTGPSGAIAGATIQINSGGSHFTLKTDKNGHYAFWLAAATHVQVICSKDGFVPQVKSVTVKKGATTTVNFTMVKS